MSSRFVVEMDGRTVGVGLRCRGGFRFFASEPLLHPLDGFVFPRARALFRAVQDKGKSQIMRTPNYSGSRRDQGGEHQP